MNINNLMTPFTCNNYAVRSDEVSFGKKLVSLSKSGKPDTVEIKNKNQCANQLIKEATKTIAEAESLISKVQESASEVKEEAEKLYKDSTLLLMRKGRKSGIKVADITQKGETECMTELDFNGSVLRQSTFENGNLQTVETRSQTGNATYIFNDGELFAYTKDRKKNKDGSVQYGEVLKFENGKLSTYFKNYEKSKDGTIRSNEALNFENGIPIRYAKECCKFTDGTVFNQKRLKFENGEPSAYSIDYREFKSGTKTIEKGLHFKDGKPDAYVEEFIRNKNGQTRFKKEISLNSSK